jgi:hypothetical protein
MRRHRALRFAPGMPLRRTLIVATAALAIAAPTALADGSPPVKDGVKCTMKIKRKLPLAKVLRHGLPVKVTCDGPAKFLVMPDFAAMSKASQEYDHLYGARRPPKARIRYGELTEAGTVTLRPRFTKVGAKIMRRFKSTRIITGLGTLREDDSYWSDPGDWAYAKLIR